MKFYLVPYWKFPATNKLQRKSLFMDFFFFYKWKLRSCSLHTPMHSSKSSKNSIELNFLLPSCEENRRQMMAVEKLRLLFTRFSVQVVWTHLCYILCCTSVFLRTGKSGQGPGSFRPLPIGCMNNLHEKMTPRKNVM